MTIEVIGARTLGQFVVQPVGEIDNIALAAALNESTSRTATEFARIDSAKAVSEPSASELQLVNKIESTNDEMSQVFFDSELANPVRMSDLNLPTGGKWISVIATATKYSPGTVVYLALTSDPIVISEAVVYMNGNAVIEGSFPIQITGSGGHRLRVVGTRQYADVMVDDKDEVKLSNKTIAEIRLFDMQTSAIVRNIGPNPTGGQNLAVRVVPLRAKLPWWIIWICGWADNQALSIATIRPN